MHNLTYILHNYWSIPNNTNTEPIKIWKIVISAILLLHGMICLFVVQPLYYRNRHHEYFKHRSPNWVLVFNIYAAVSMCIIALQELLISSGHHYPCIITWFMNMIYICCLSCPATIRGWQVAVKFTPALRKTAARRFLLQSGQIKFIGTMAMICVPFYIAMLFAWPYYMSATADRQCSFNAEWYAYIPYTIYALHRSKKLKHCMSGVDDYYNIGHEVRIGFSAQTYFMLYYIIEVVLFILTYTTIYTRSYIESYALPFDYYIYGLYFVRLHATSTNTIIQYKKWKKTHYVRRESRSSSTRDEHSTTRTTQVYSTTVGSSNINFDLMMNGNPQDDDTLALYQPAPASYQDGKSTPLMNQLMTGDNKNDRATLHKKFNLLRILNDNELRAAFTIHANKSLCGEMMVYYNEMHEFRQSMILAKQLSMSVQHTIDETHSATYVDPNRFGVSVDEIKIFGCGIYGKYVSVGSEYELNVNATLRQQFESVINDIQQNAQTNNNTPVKPAPVKSNDNNVHQITVLPTSDQRVDLLWSLCNSLQKEIYNLLNTNLFKSFQNTNIFKQYVAEQLEMVMNQKNEKYQLAVTVG